MINARKKDFKIVIVGDCFVGKTTLLRKYIGKMDLSKSPFEIHELDRHGEKIFLEIHDTNGQEKYRSLTHSFYRGTNGCLVCFDLMKPASFEGLKNWIYDIKECTGENIPKVLVGIHRGDIGGLENPSTVSKHNIDLFCDLYELHYVEVDLNIGKNISQCFETLTDLIISEKHRRTRELYDNIDIVHLPRQRDEKKESVCFC